MGLHRQLHTYMGLHRQLRGASSETTGSPPCGLSVPVSPSACHVTSPRLQLLLTHTYTLCGLYVFMCSKKWLSQTLTSLTLTSRSGAVVELETWIAYYWIAFGWHDKLRTTTDTDEVWRTSFSYTSGAVWNLLPDELHRTPTMNSFKRKLKTHLFT